MYTLTTTLFLLSASALLVQANTIPSGEESKAVNITNNGFSLQTGYEGYIASVNRPKTTKYDLLTQLETFVKSDFITKITLFKNALIAAKTFLLPVALKIFAGTKFATFVLLWGVVATHTVCKFTSLCSFSMNLPDINKEDIKERISNIARPYMSDETLNYTLRMVRSAMDSYTSVQDFV